MTKGKSIHQTSIFAFQLSFLDVFKAVSGALYRLGKIEAMTRLGKEFEGSSLGVRSTGGRLMEMLGVDGENPA